MSGQGPSTTGRLVKPATPDDQVHERLKAMVLRDLRRDQSAEQRYLMSLRQGGTASLAWRAAIMDALDDFQRWRLSMSTARLWAISPAHPDVHAPLGPDGVAGDGARTSAVIRPGENRRARSKPQKAGRPRRDLAPDGFGAAGEAGQSDHQHPQGARENTA